MKKIKKWLIGTLCLACICTTTVGFAVAQQTAVADVVLSEVTLETEYGLNTEFQIPKAKIAVDGVEYEADGILVFPSGIKYDKSLLILSECGTYIIEYSALVNGKKYVCTKSFLTRQSNYDATYATYEDDGLHIVLTEANPRFTINQVLDVSNLTEDMAFLQVGHGVSEGIWPQATLMKYILTDAYDSSKNITLYSSMMHIDKDGLPNQCSYLSVSYTQSNGIQSLIKGERGGSIHVGGTSGNLSNPAPDFLSDFRFNYNERAIYNGNPWQGGRPSLVADMDDPLFFNDGWDGFTTGEVYLSVEVGSLSYPSVEIVLKQLHGVDLSTLEDIVDEQAPQITVDYGEYTEKDYPYALVGESYPVYKAKAWDVSGLFGKTLNPNVYFGYGLPNYFEVDVVDGAFKTDLKGTYSIVYRAEDAFGNKAELVVPVRAYTSEELFDVTVNEESFKNATTGLPVTVSDIVPIGAVGIAKTSVRAIQNGITQTLVADENGNFSFVPTQSGEYKLIVTVMDYLNRTVNKEYTINVVSQDKSIITQDVIFPAYLYEGYAFNAPKMRAFNYKANREVAVDVYMTDKNGEIKATDKTVYAEVNTDKDFATFTYKVANEVLKTYQVPVLKVGDSSTLQMDKFFLVDEGVQVIPSLNYMSFVAKADATVQYTNKLLAESFSLKFDVDKKKNSYQRITVVLTDSENSNIFVKLRFQRKNDGVVCLVNDMLSGANISSSFTKESNQIEFEYTDDRQRLLVNGQTIYILNDYKGNEFKGFPSHYLNLSFEIEEVTGESGLQVYHISRQVFSSDYEEFVNPSYYIDGEYGGSFMINDIYTLNKIYAGDVLSQQVEVSYTVTDPNGKTMKSTDGENLANVDGSKVRSCVLYALGEYTVHIKMKDQNGNSMTIRYNVTVNDLEKPTIKVSGVPKSAKVGATVQLPKASANEALIGEKVFINVKKPDGTIEKVHNNKFTADKKGTYTVCYYAIDEKYNITELYFEIVVK
ncbi:MAG: hypothetical protein IJB97_03350 [Clostridia bacterium]|nr:hypothetical protein [Clostridia bacterium]